MASSFSTLQDIRTKVRRLTRALSTSQLSDADVDYYINTFVLYDFPEHLRLFDLKTTLSFYTQAFIDVYETTALPIPATDPLFDFKNTYLTIHPPVYIAGYQAFFSQSREQFFSVYPKIVSINLITNGNGVTTTYTGRLPFAQPSVNPNSLSPVLRNNVLFTSRDVNDNTLTLIDDPQSVTTGNLIIPNDTSTGNTYGTINYTTGNYTVNFPVAPKANVAINSESISYQPSLPQGVLYYDNKFTLRPVPDQAYKVTMDVYIQPTELLQAAQKPKIAQWWQYIAYGAAKKIFEDRQDMDSVQMIMPEFKKQEALVLRKTIVQYTNDRTATIYSEQTGIGASGNWWGYGGPF